MTVPSCDAHNSHKSKDDEFLRTVLTMQSAQASSAAWHQFSNKVRSAAQQRPAAYGSFFTDRGLVGEGIRALQIDRVRFDACIEHLAKALYFHTYSEKRLLPINVVSPTLFVSSETRGATSHEPTQAAVEITLQFLDGETPQGENPEVFEYCLRRESAMYAFAARFYESFEVYAASSPELAAGAA